MKIGIYGGAFNPIHLGHMALAREAVKEYQLDMLMFIPTGRPPHKQAITSDTDDRIAMLEIVADKFRKELSIDVSVNTMETDAKRVSYSYETLTILKDRYPGDELYFIMGGDSVSCFGKWVHPEIIAKKAVILAGRRNDISADEIMELTDEYKRSLGADLRLVDSPYVKASSSFIREYLGCRTWDDADIRLLLQYLDGDVLEYMKKYRLYTTQKT